MGECAVDSCEKPVKRVGLCYGHYMKQWRYGTTEPEHSDRTENLAGQRFGSLIVAADRNADGWLCRCDCGEEVRRPASQLRRRTAHTCGDRATHYRGDVIAYCTAHDRVAADRGKASTHRCVDCGSPAEQWSYNHDDPNHLLGPTGDRAMTIAPYSVHPAHYSPRCVRCHRRFDLARHRRAA